MPSIPLYDSPQETAKPLPQPDLSSVASPDLLGGIAAQNKIRQGAGMVRAANALTDVVVNMRQRESADAIFRAETQLKDNHIKQEQDWRQNRQGRYALGLTKDANDWWTEQIQQQSDTLGTPEQKRIFARRAT